MQSVEKLAERAAAGQLGRDDALWLATAAPFDELLFHANRLRQNAWGDSVHLCSIINAKSGACSEDCAFCAQSARHRTAIDIYPLVPPERMLDAARLAAESAADSFGIVTSGESACDNPRDFDAICAAAAAVRSLRGLKPCVSIGSLTPAGVARLKAAGVRRIHHNLETSERFFPHICTTHPYARRVETVRNIKAAGLEACSGGLFGLGETWDDRVDLALELRRLDVDGVPINFLNPIPGTPLAAQPLLDPRVALRIVALYRFLLPAKEIKVCGGRTVTLRDLQSWVFLAGASGIMIGNYLTTTGRSIGDDLRMLADLGLHPHLKTE
jgi:biotin synthase